MDKLLINKLLFRSNFKTENDFKFFSRVYNDGDLSKYSNRLRNIGFCNLDNVLITVVDLVSGLLHFLS